VGGDGGVFVTSSKVPLGATYDRPMPLTVTLLGTGNPVPDAHRAGAATLVTAGERHLLVDAGRGVCLRLAAAGVLPVMLDRVLLTHLHSDHLCDLNDVVTTHWVMCREPATLRILGPEGTRDVVDGLSAMLRHDVEFRIAHHADLTWAPDLEVSEVGPGVVVDDGGLRVLAAATEHPPVRPSLAYRFEHDGRSVVVAGDTVPCAGLDELCRGADVYVQTVLRDDLVRRVAFPRFVDTIEYHSTVAQAAQTAARAGVRTLVLTHQIPTPAAGSAEEWVAIARAHFDGEIVFGKDLTVV